MSIVSKFNGLLNLIFPRRCVFCYSIIDDYSNTDGVCLKCKNSLPYCAAYDCCTRCGIPMLKNHADNSGDKICYSCRSTKHSFARNISVFKYTNDNNVKRSVFRYKKSGKQHYANVYAEFMKTLIADKYDGIKFDYVVNVPTKSKSIQRSGFDHAKLLTKKVAELIDAQYLPKALVLTRKAQSQKRLTRDERELNLIGAFKVRNSEKIQDKRLLIIDDVFTTGSTINECSYMLVKAGAAEVYSVTLAITVRRV